MDQWRFFVLSSKIFKFIKNDKTVWEREPLENLAKKKTTNFIQARKILDCHGYNKR